MIYRQSTCSILYFVLVVAASTAQATSWIPLSPAQLADRADLIVVGTAATEDDRATIHVEETLKGPELKFVALVSVHLLWSDPNQVRDGMEAVFLLRAEPDGRYALYHPGSVQPLERLEQVKRALAILDDPAPFVAASNRDDAFDVAYALGVRFARFRVQNPDVPSLERWFDWRVVPWAMLHRIEMRCTFDDGDKPQLKVEPVPPLEENDPLYRYLRNQLRAAVLRAHIVNQLPEQFTVALDMRLPEPVGDLSYADAARHLRSLLRSADDRVIRITLEALAKLGDLDAVPAVIDLLGHPQREVRHRTIDFLRYARDDRATEALAVAMLGDDAQYRLTAELAAQALEAINDPEALPALHAAARQGIERASIALGRIGTEESFVVMLETAEKNPTVPGPQAGMWWLVHRSNKEVEEWMNPSHVTESTRAFLVPRWREWWDANADDFELARSYEETLSR